jgi:hypothetical protein
MQASPARLTRSSRVAGLGWAAALFVLVIALFGVVLIGHTLKWPIYVSILAWWGFVVYEANHE